MATLGLVALALPWPFDRPYMQLALAAGLAVGICAPLVGAFLVERRMSLIGDGIGHLAFAGVSAGMLFGVAPVWAALVAAVLGAVGLEVLRARGRGAGDLSLAVVFYGGIAGGVVMASAAGRYDASALSYLFGSILTVRGSEVVASVLVALVIVAFAAVAWRTLFVCVTNEDFARTLGIDVRVYNVALAVSAAVVITVAMRVVGVLLVAALMVLPVGVARQLAGSFRSTLLLSSATGAACVVTGLVLARWRDLPPGGTTVLVAAAAVAVVQVVHRQA